MAAGSRSSSSASASRIWPTVEVAVAGADEGGLDGVGGAGPAQAGLLAQHDRLGVLGARGAQRLLLHVGAGDQTGLRPDLEARRRLPQAVMAGAIGCSTS